MPTLQPAMKAIRLVVPEREEFAPIRDLDGTVTRVAAPKGSYRFRRGDASFEFESTGRTETADGVSAEVFTAHRADVKLPLARGA
ncbi:hypothetical protein O4J56_22350 [Nocardiopsis sp. RSe5-2]|uniref:Uncharacterized protein n=1 Tax=Nocardiopsis endophytica TaxID=3018445 RepID=A0ABT4U8X9_9ACTN|nr:hypothetical protein [Nocardiopsis endophytica]MDA2813404.1 hypothetical protein [Nocardiopsis endophytica]